MLVALLGLSPDQIRGMTLAEIEAASRYKAKMMGG